MNLTEEFAALVAALARAEVEFAVCGGMALAMHGYPRFTKAIDLLIEPERLNSALAVAQERGFTDDVEVFRLGQQSGYSCEIHRVSKFQGDDFLTLDFILASGVLEKVWADRQRFQWQKHPLEVVSPSGLAKMKHMAGRPQDLADIQNLGFQLDDPRIQP